MNATLPRADRQSRPFPKENSPYGDWERRREAIRLPTSCVALLSLLHRRIANPTLANVQSLCGVDTATNITLPHQGLIRSHIPSYSSHLLLIKGNKHHSYYHLLPPITTYHLLLPLITSYYHLSPLITSYYHLLPLIIYSVCKDMQPCTKCNLDGEANDPANIRNIIHFTIL